MQGKVPSQQSATAPVYIGIDVCKARLDVFINPVGATFAFANDTEGLKKLNKIIARFDVALIVMEATGKFHRLAHRHLHDSGFKVAIVNPLRSRRFAEAIGTLAKTDRVDARMLALMGESLKPEALEPAPELMTTLQELARGRETAVELRTAILNQIHASNSKVLLRALNRQLRVVETTIRNLEAELLRQIEADPILARRYQILTSIPGIGLVTAVALIVELGEIGRLSSKQVAMIVGLAPIACDSGQRTGRREIRGGRKHLRTALYMPANSARQHNPDLKIFHDRLVKAGKLAKVAITAVMRKLAVLANTLVREDRPWEPRGLAAK